MRKLILTISVLFFCLIFFTPAETPDYDVLIARAQAKKTAGIVTTISGLGCYVISLSIYYAGLIQTMSTVGDTDSMYDSYGSDLEAPYFIPSYTFALAGTALGGIGIPLWIVGGVQKAKYTRRKNKSLSSELTPAASIAVRPILDINPFKGETVSLGLQFCF